jgi:O-acetyl-ADP-ribose deacetylase (regulator of RNase III)
MSADAGVPMATRDHPEIKSVVTLVAEHLFLRRNRRSPGDRTELEAWLDEEGLLQDPTCRYSDALQLVAPDNEGRQRYLEQFFSGRRPTSSHEAIARFVAAGLFRQTFTTNFDPLLERALLFSGLDVAVVGEAGLVAKLARTAAPIVYKVHGDYLFTNHKHTRLETSALEAAMHVRLRDTVAERPILVIGHSGSDASITTALMEGLARGSDSVVLWLLYKNESPSPLLQALAADHPERVWIASIPGYPDFWTAAEKRILERAPAVRADPRILASQFIGTTEVTLLQGEIWEVGAEAIVSPDDAHLGQQGMTSGQIAAAAGPALGRDLAQFAGLLPLPPGEVLATGPGLLADRQIRYILHAAVTSDWQVPARAVVARRCTERVLQEVEARGIQTVAIPALGAGRGSLPPDEVADAVVGGVVAHLRRGSYIKQVLFVVQSEAVMDAFYSRQMPLLAAEQERAVRSAIQALPTELATWGEAVLSGANWGLHQPEAVNTWLRELVAQGASIAGEMVRFCHARWHTHLCHLLARASFNPSLAGEIQSLRRQLQALEVTYAFAFRP